MLTWQDDILFLYIIAYKFKIPIVAQFTITKYIYEYTAKYDHQIYKGIYKDLYCGFVNKVFKPDCAGNGTIAQSSYFFLKRIYF